MSDMKRCKQCGILKDADEFREYTYSKKNKTGGRFSLCKTCESINTKYKRIPQMIENLMAQPGSNSKVYELEAEYAKIEKLYDALEQRGLHVPIRRSAAATEETRTVAAIDKLLSFYDTLEPAPPSTQKAILTESKVSVPKELQQWLDEDMETWITNGLSPEFLQETIYESLKAKYRPQIGIDPQKFIPIYDDTYKDILNEILRKFDDYEEEAAFEEEYNDEISKG